MKKLFLVMLAAAGVAVTSCERSFDENGAAAGGEATVSVNLGFPTMQTRAAYSDGTTATELQYAVYEVKGSELDIIDTYPETTEILISKKIDFQLVTGRTYRFVFWAGAPSVTEGDDQWTSPYTVELGENGATMTVDYSKAVANDERYDAFFASVEKKITGDVEMSVELTRPFAQINVGTNDYDVAEKQGCAPDLSQVVLSKAYTSLDLVTGKVSDLTDEGETVTFGFNKINADEEKFPIDDYEYLAMVYVLASTEQEADYTVTFSYKEGQGEATDRTVGSVPVQRNHRTNMFGQVLTSTASVNVIIVPEYEEPDHNYSQLLFAAAVGGSAVLDDDVDLNDHKDVLTFTRDAVIDLNGKTITGLDGKDGAITVTNGANVTIKGNGQIISNDPNHSMVIWVADKNSSVTIEDGYYEGPGTDDQLIYCEIGTIYIKGGTFKLPDHDYTLNCKDTNAANGTAKFVVTGGKFWNFDPANSIAEGKNQTFNWVPAGYKSVKTTIEGEDWYMVVPADTDIIEVPSTMNQEDFNNAISEAAETAIFYLGEGANFSLPKDVLTNKNFTFVGNGADKSIINSLNYETATGSSLTFENLTLQVAKGGSATSLGFSGVENITLKDVTVKGEFHTFTAKTALFEGCTFNFDDVNTTDRQGVWCDAYGTTVFKDCVFQVLPPDNGSNETKAILIYSNDNFVMGDVEVTNCEFKEGVKSAKAAVEIHSEKMTSAGTVTITNCNYHEATYGGGLWREIYNVEGNGHTKGEKTQFYTVIVDGKEVQTKAQ